MNFKVRRVNIWLSWRMIVKGFWGYQPTTSFSFFSKENGEAPMGAIYRVQGPDQCSMVIPWPSARGVGSTTFVWKWIHKNIQQTYLLLYYKTQNKFECLTVRFQTIFCAFCAFLRYFSKPGRDDYFMDKMKYYGQDKYFMKSMKYFGQFEYYMD